MNKKQSALTSKITELGVGLASRQRSATADIVLERPKNLKPLVKYMGLYLNAGDVAILNEVELWARQNGLRIGRGALLKAGIRLIRKDETGLLALRQAVASDGRYKS